MAHSKKPLAAALGAAFLATSIAPLASAASNPFAAEQLSGGYDLANYYNKQEEGSCGEKKAEGSCGEKKAEGSCGEKKAEGSCGDKKTEETAAEEKKAEGKCGEAKCGADK